MAWDIAIAVLIGFTIFTFGYLAVQIDKKHGALQILFLALTLFTMLLGTSISIDMANNNTQASVATMLGGGYSIYVWATMFVIAYLIIMIIYNAFAKQKGESEEE